MVKNNKKDFFDDILKGVNKKNYLLDKILHIEETKSDFSSQKSSINRPRDIFGKTNW
jgi:hypothetical protein